MIRRVFTERKTGFDTEAQQAFSDLRNNFNIKNLEKLRIINVYDAEGLSVGDVELCKNTVFSNPSIDELYSEVSDYGDFSFRVKYLPGHFDQRADSAIMCIQAVIGKDDIVVETSKLYVCLGNLSEDEKAEIKRYFINPVDSTEVGAGKPESLALNAGLPEISEEISGFIQKPDNENLSLKDELGLAMSKEDLLFVRDYFRDTEKRDPTITEIRVIDTYWSDHCRHTTFNTALDEIEFEDGPYRGIMEEVFALYLKEREEVYSGRDRPVTLMDIATMGMKSLRKKGQLDDLDVSGEINACSVNVDVDVDGICEKWLLQFKNETHNHPTEIEPFGGAATCLGGAIRDPLSGRAYVYQAMRVTGSGEPRMPVENTIPGKIPQRKLTRTAAEGYSFYGNQIGVAAGLVSEIYDEGYVAKRMELGAVIGAVKKDNIQRSIPEKGDVVILVGGKTGRDGCGGATGSSKEQEDDSIPTFGEEVPKGNAPAERKILRLFRNPEVLALIKRCNDFGAGGVSVAVGELAEGLLINLDLVPTKYLGLSGTDLAISESQERMAVVVSEADAEKFIGLSRRENI